MQCLCGGSASSSKATISNPKCVLKFLECADCKRVSDAVLYIKDVEVARDSGAKPSARDAFCSMTPDLAKALLNGARLALETHPAIDDDSGKANGPLTEPASVSPSQNPPGGLAEQGVLF